MLEEVLTTARANPKIDPSLGIWHWEVPVYLFVGGLTAGIMLFAAIMVIMRREQLASFVSERLALWGPIVLSVGMGTLFLDLEHKLYVWRFYTTFQLTSPMSWGSWILMLVYPISIFQALSSLRGGYPRLAAYMEALPLGTATLDFAERRRMAIAISSVPVAVALGIYTGILLSAFSARPFWNTGVLGPLFLVSGLSTAAALVMLVSRQAEEKHLFARIDIGLILVELLLIALLIVNLKTGTAVHLTAVSHILGGAYTVPFWFFFVGLGLLVPLWLEYRELRGSRFMVFLAPVLVLAGGYLLRHITVDLGQVTTWIEYADQFDSALMHRLY